MAKSCFLGQKRVERSFLAQKFGQISQKLAEICQKKNSRSTRGPKSVFCTEINLGQISQKIAEILQKVVFQA